MHLNKKWGIIFEIGDFIKYRNQRGKVIYVQEPTYEEVGYYKIINQNGLEFIDYFYCFELDKEYNRDYKLKELGI